MRRTALLLLLMPGPLLADEVFLKGGGKFTGRITEQDEERITVDIGDGSVGFSMERVERIVKGMSPLDEYDSQASKLAPQDVDGWRKLAQWASSKGLSKTVAAGLGEGPRGGAGRRSGEAGAGVRAARRPLAHRRGELPVLAAS